MSGQAILRGKYAAGRYLVAGAVPRELVYWMAEPKCCAVVNCPLSA